MKQQQKTQIFMRRNASRKASSYSYAERIIYGKCLVAYNIIIFMQKLK